MVIYINLWWKDKEKMENYILVSFMYNETKSREWTFPAMELVYLLFCYRHFSYRDLSCTITHPSPYSPGWTEEKLLARLVGTLAGPLHCRNNRCCSEHNLFREQAMFICLLWHCESYPWTQGAFWSILTRILTRIQAWQTHCSCSACHRGFQLIWLISPCSHKSTVRRPAAFPAMSLYS